MTSVTVQSWRLDLGANTVPGKGVFFRVWAPNAGAIAVRVASGGGGRETSLKKESHGYFSGLLEGASAGDRYHYVLDGKDYYPDPASRFQPGGVHGPSQVVDPEDFRWSDDGWKGIELKDFIIYELHVGTFTREGTFEAIIPYLDYLVALGITAIEVMPVAQFPGDRNWGYDGAYPFAPQNTYGGPDGFKKLINAAHEKGLSVILDVVYNHLGPEGNYLRHYAPYFTEKYRTLWGDAVNFDGPFSDEVRQFFISNALYWINEYHIDTLRLDAVHAIFDFSARHFLEDLRDAVSALIGRIGRNAYLIAESDLNDVRIINPADVGGYGLDAQWNDDFHHALHALITGEGNGYYQDFGRVADLGKALKEGFAYSGQYSRFRRRRHGNSSKYRPAHQFIVFSQSHDQIGNTIDGSRLSQTQPFEKLKLSAGAVLLSPNIPLLFMGEEYGETAPFQYFTSHGDNALAHAVNKGRAEELSSTGSKREAPDSQAESTFLNSKLSVEAYSEGNHKVLYDFYRELIRLRKEISVPCSPSKDAIDVKCFEEEKVLFLRRASEEGEIFVMFNFGANVTESEVFLRDGTWDKLLESSSRRWGGAGCLAQDTVESRGAGIAIRLQPHSFALYRIVTKER